MKKYIEYNVESGKLKLIYMLILAVLFSLNNGAAQKSQTTPGRQSSIEEFTKGNYEQAYNDFSLLLEKYPKDPLYKYYSGVCLVMLRRDPAKALTLLDQSVNGASVVRSLPDDALFYLGRAQQMSGKFTEAIKSFSSYTDDVGKKAAREKGVPGYIQECESKKGMIAATNPAAALAAPAATVVTPEAISTVTVTDAAAAAKPDLTSVNEKNDISKPLAEPAVVVAANKTAGSEISERKEIPAESEILLDDALKLQYKSDSLNQLASEQKKMLEKADESEKASIRMKMTQNLMLASSYQTAADARYNSAQVKMNQKSAVIPQQADTMPKVVMKETVREEEVIKTTQPAAAAETAVKVSPVTQKVTGVTSLFEVLPKDAAYPDEKIKIDPEMPAGLIYRIQLAVFRNPVPPSFFKGITPVYGLRVAGTDKTNYYAGMFRRSADAKKALVKVKETGFKDSFVVATADGKPVSSDRAAVLENEWGNKPFYGTSGPGAVADTIPPTLTFRVEVARAAKPLKPDALESLKTMAGGRGMDILHLSDGNIVYLIGKFITFESAAEYADLLVRNNYRTAKVVAWLGNKEVPIETAKQLFKDLQ